MTHFFFKQQFDAIPNSKSSGSTINPYTHRQRKLKQLEVICFPHGFNGVGMCRESGSRTRTTKPSLQRSHIRSRRDSQRGSLDQSAPAIIQESHVQNILEHFKTNLLCSSQLEDVVLQIVLQKECDICEQTSASLELQHQAPRVQ